MAENNTSAKKKKSHEYIDSGLGGVGYVIKTFADHKVNLVFIVFMFWFVFTLSLIGSFIGSFLYAWTGIEGLDFSGVKDDVEEAGYQLGDRIQDVRFDVTFDIEDERARRRSQDRRRDRPSRRSAEVVTYDDLNQEGE